MSLTSLNANKQELNDMPEIYVASLSDYNSGILHGRWINAVQEPDEIHDQIQDMLKESKQPNSEEWAIHDCSGFFDINLSEYENIENLTKIAQGISKHGEAFASYTDMINDMEIVDIEGFSDSYQGEYDSEMQFAEEMMGLCYSVPDYLEPYVDYEKFARDLFMSDYTSVRSSTYSYHIFRND